MALMHRITILVAAAALLAAPVASAGVTEPVGTPLRVTGGDNQTFPAGEPFFVRHGWLITPQKKYGDLPGTSQTQAVGRYTFTLSVDGTVGDPSFVDRYTESNDQYPLLLTRFWGFEFAQGMTGTHTFTGRWYAPCATAQFLEPTLLCDNPSTPVLAGERTTTVRFVRTNLALGKTATASHWLATNPPSDAVDGSSWSYWNSGGFAPQWFEVDLGSVYDVGEIDLSITQLPDSYTVHDVYGRASTAEPWTLLHEFAGFTVDQQVLRLTTDANIRYVRVQSTASASWIAWREVEVYRLGG
jgi:hypothetical protein